MGDTTSAPTGWAGADLILDDVGDERFTELLGDDRAGVLVDGAELELAAVLGGEAERGHLHSTAAPDRGHPTLEGLEIEKLDAQRRSPHAAVVGSEKQPVEGARRITLPRHDRDRVLHGSGRGCADATGAEVEHRVATVTSTTCGLAIVGGNSLAGSEEVRWPTVTHATGVARDQRLRES